MTDYYDGIDISHHQGVFNFATSKLAGANYCIIRAGSIDRISLTPYTDFQWERNKVEGPKHYPCGTYWFFRPTRALLQADYYYSLIKDLPLLLPPVIDVEVNTLWTSSGDVTISPKEVADQADLFINRIKILTGKYPMLYTRMSFWTPNVEDRPLWSLLKLWTARYSSFLTSPWSDGLYPPRDWALDGWSIWQWSADGNNLGPLYGADSDDIDLNRFNGTKEAFDQQFDLLPPPPPPPPHRNP